MFNQEKRDKIEDNLYTVAFFVYLALLALYIGFAISAGTDTELIRHTKRIGWFTCIGLALLAGITWGINEYTKQKDEEVYKIDWVKVGSYLAIGFMMSGFIFLCTYGIVNTIWNLIV